MNWKYIATSLICLLAGIVIGRLLPGSSADDGPPVISATGPGPGAYRQARTRHTRAVPPMGEVALATPQAAASNDGAVAVDDRDKMLSVPAALISRLSLAAGSRKLDQDLFSGDGAVEEALQITDHEKAVIQTAWRDALRKIRDIEATSVHTEAIDEWSQRITLPELSSSMEVMSVGFRSHVRNTLGTHRGEAFLAAKQVDQLIGRNTGERVYTVTTEEVGDGTWRYRIHVEQGEQRRLWVGGNIPEEIRHLTERAGITNSLEN